jgi:hypothetical protein
MNYISNIPTHKSFLNFQNSPSLIYQMNFKITGILIVLVDYRGNEHDPSSEKTHIQREQHTTSLQKMSFFSNFERISE